MSENNKALFQFIRGAFTILIILVVIYGAVSLAMTGYEFGYRVFTETAIDEAPGKDVMVLVKEDMSQKEIAEMLEEKGLIRDSRLFLLQLKLSAYSGKLLPGVYTLNTSMEPKEMMVVMATVPEAETETEDTSGDSTTVTDESDEGTMTDESDDGFSLDDVEE
jgi:UPF0755 protein